MKKNTRFAALASFMAAPACWFFFPPPWNWLALFPACALGFGLLASAARGAVPRYVFLTAMSGFLAFAAVEVYFHATRQPLDSGAGSRPTSFERIRDQRNIPHLLDWDTHITHERPHLGYGPKERAGVHAAWRTLGQELLYSVLYTTLDSGWRITPRHPRAETGVVFFGCSMTFGMGLNDEESFPYRVGKALGERYQVYNFGFPGYGAHQLLAMVENGFLDPIVQRHRKVLVYFTSIGTHEVRSLKNMLFTRGPWYELENGQPVLKGDLEKKNAWREALYKYLGSSQFFHDLLQYPPPDIPTALELYAALIERAEKLARQRHGLPFTVILWPEDLPKEAVYKEMLESRGIRCLDLNALLPELYGRRAEHILHPHDHHASAAATALVAPLLARDILERTHKNGSPRAKN